jgi:hypothetical protein
MASPSASTSTAPPASPSVVPEDPKSSEEEESESDGEPIVLLLDGREKRHNAGNRMRALLDEEDGAGEVEEMFKDEEGDGEFETKGGSSRVFGSGLCAYFGEGGKVKMVMDVPRVLRRLCESWDGEGRRVEPRVVFGRR